jgi:hypothetical protein
MGVRSRAHSFVASVRIWVSCATLVDGDLSEVPVSGLPGHQEATLSSSSNPMKAMMLPVTMAGSGRR